MKWISLLLFLIFSLFAYWQINDADPYYWVTWYGFIAFVALLTVLNKNNIWIIRVGLIIGCLWMLSLVPDFVNWIKMGAPTITGQMKAEAPHVELTREFFGLLISIGALLFLGKQLSSR